MTNNWTREDDAGGLLGIAMILLAICSCGNSSKYAYQSNKNENAPVKIEHRENSSMNQFYKTAHSHMIYIK